MAWTVVFLESTEHLWYHMELWAFNLKNSSSDATMRINVITTYLFGLITLSYTDVSSLKNVNCYFCVGPNLPDWLGNSVEFWHLLSLGFVHYWLIYRINRVTLIICFSCRTINMNEVKKLKEKMPKHLQSLQVTYDFMNHFW